MSRKRGTSHRKHRPPRTQRECEVDPWPFDLVEVVWLSEGEECPICKIGDSHNQQEGEG